MLTELNAYNSLLKHVGCDLHHLALENGITVVGDESGKINKGFKGLTLERLAGITANNHKAPNGLGFEMKSAGYKIHNGWWVPNETMAIAMINPKEFVTDEFFKSHLWDKLKRIIFCITSWYGPNTIESRLLKITTFDLLDDEFLINEIKKNYELIQNKLKKYGFESLTGEDGKYIQTRTKGVGHGTKTKAFYARKNFLNVVCPPFKVEPILLPKAA